MVFTSYLHGIYIVFTWYLHSIYMVFTSYLHRIYMVFTSYMVFTWYLHGIYIVFTSYLHGIYMVFTSYLHCIWNRYTVVDPSSIHSFYREMKPLFYPGSSGDSFRPSECQRLRVLAKGTARCQSHYSTC